jgi:hypothetical protein
MHNQIVKIAGLIALIVGLLGCTEKPFQAQELKLDLSKAYVDLAETLVGDWERVCLITPYSSNEYASEVVGFHVNVEERSRISVLDGISLLVTVKNQNIEDMYEVPRKNLDFSSLGAHCYERGNARFTIKYDKFGQPHANHT